LDENFFPADHTFRFDEVPLCPLQRSTACATGHLCEHSVDLKRVPPKSLPDRTFREIAFRRGSGPQGLRRPRFSFFRFTCQTARKPGGFRSPVRREADEAEASDHDRMLVPAISEELRRRAIAPVSGRRAVWTGLYGRRHPIVNHQTDASEVHGGGRDCRTQAHFPVCGAAINPPHAALGPHSSAVLCTPKSAGGVRSPSTATEP